jgi:hypothetical protein
MNRLIQFKKSTAPFLVPLVFACFALLQRAQAVSPAPGGGYPHFTTAEGDKALFSLSTGAGNTALGWRSLFLDTTGSLNTAVGAGTLLGNTADQNTAVGAGALLSNTTGGAFTGGGTTLAGPNVAVGTFALASNTTSGANVAVGYLALSSMTTGVTYPGAVNFGGSTAVGFKALASAGASGGTGAENSAFGVQALVNDTTGSRNVAIGNGALASDTIGEANTALGWGAGFFQTTGQGNVYIGFGAAGVAGENDQTYITNINTTPLNGGNTDTVTVDLGSGLLGHLSSSRRYKEDIKPMDSASEAIYRLKPVAYRYKKEIDRTQSPAFGLIAEEVAEVNPNLVACNSHGQPESVHYEMVNAMLLNEFLKEHRKNEEQAATIAQQRKDFDEAIARQQKQIDALTAGLQKVSAQLEMSKATPQTVSNNE